MKQRLVTGVIAGVLFLAAVAAGGYAFHGLLLAMALVGFDELRRMSGIRASSLPALIGYAAVILFVFPASGGRYIFSGQAETWIWLAMFLLLAAMVLTKNATPIQPVSVLMLGIVYIGAGFHYMALTRWMDDGLWWTLLLFICIWATDAGAYFTGYAIGKHKLWPAISPNKTIEGALGGLALSIVAALAFAWLKPELFSFERAWLLGLAVGVVGQIGDLIQSAYKRTFGVKDSGKLLPGHGGILDRCDSWLVVFPFMHLIVQIA